MNFSNYSQFLNFFPNPVLVTDDAVKIIHANPAWEKLTGYKLKEVLGKNPSILQSGKTNRWVYRKMWQALSKNKPFFSEEITDLRKDGSEYQIFSTFFPLQNGQAKVYIQIQYDITSRKIAEKELTKYSQELSILNKQLNQALMREKEVEKSKTEFLSITAHELRTPLTAVCWSLEKLCSACSTKNWQGVEKNYAKIDQACQQMITMVDQLLQVGKLEMEAFAPRVTDIDIEKLIKSIVSGAKVQIENKRIKFRAKIDHNIPPVRADVDSLRVVIDNLLSNALKFTPTGGKVSLSVSKNKQFDYLIIKVSDTGLGIPKNSQNKIFQRFFRAANIKPKIEGSGLGLYITKLMVGKLGGEISFQSPAGKNGRKGTEFMVSLPL